MTPRSKKTAAALSGALVIASGAYALGTQTGDGTALAGGTLTTSNAGAPPARAGGPRDLSGIAAQLGVTEAKLRAAFEKLRDEFEKQRDARKDAFAAELAGKLGISEAKVKEVMDSVGHHGRRGP